MEGNQNYKCEVCGTANGRCGRCGHYCGFGGNHILRWVLGILIITWVFSIGMKFGEMKAMFGGGYGGYGMREFRVYSPGFSTGPGMMQGTNDVMYFNQAMPTTGAAGSVKIIKQ